MVIDTWVAIHEVSLVSNDADCAAFMIHQWLLLQTWIKFNLSMGK